MDRRVAREQTNSDHPHRGRNAPATRRPATRITEVEEDMRQIRFAQRLAILDSFERQAVRALQVRSLHRKSIHPSSCATEDCGFLSLAEA